MKLTFALVATVTLMRVMNGGMAPSFGEDSVDRNEAFSADNALGDSSPEEAVVEDNRVSEEAPKRILSIGFLEANPTIEKRSQAIWKSPWVEGYPPNRRAFSPWGGKRYFNPWGGKRFKAIYLERKAESIFDKRPGFQPWGGKRSVQYGSDVTEKRAFSPWGGKRESPSRDHKNTVEDNVRQRLIKNKKLYIVKP